MTGKESLIAGKMLEDEMPAPMPMWETEAVA